MIDTPVHNLKTCVCKTCCDTRLARGTPKTATTASEWAPLVGVIAAGIALFLILSGTMFVIALAGVICAGGAYVGGQVNKAHGDQIYGGPVWDRTRQKNANITVFCSGAFVLCFGIVVHSTLGGGIMTLLASTIAVCVVFLAIIIVPQVRANNRTKAGR